jgi:hypothetical protein
MSDATSIGVNISGPNMEEAALPLAQAIVQILAADADQETLRCALEVFGRSVRVENVHLSGSNIIGPRTIHIDKDA